MTDLRHRYAPSFRIDRNVSLLLDRCQSLRGERRDWMPVLMLHSVSTRMERRRHPYFRTTIGPGEFEAQLRMLRANGYQSVTLRQILAGAWTRVQRRGHKPVLITFDDGFRDFFTSAAPLLAKWGFSAVIFLPSDLIDGSGKSFQDQACMNWNEVRELCDAGFEFGSHTASHAVLVELDLTRIEYELAHSKARIEQETGREVIAFAYPYAFPQVAKRFLRDLERLLLSCGYRLGFTTVIGGLTARTHPLFIPRLPINGCDDPDLFAAKLNGAYNWLSLLQLGHKVIKDRLRLKA